MAAGRGEGDGVVGSAANIWGQCPGTATLGSGSGSAQAGLRKTLPPRSGLS